MVPVATELDGRHYTLHTLSPSTWAAVATPSAGHGLSACGIGLHLPRAPKIGEVVMAGWLDSGSVWGRGEWAQFTWRRTVGVGAYWLRSRSFPSQKPPICRPSRCPRPPPLCSDRRAREHCLWCGRNSERSSEGGNQSTSSLFLVSSRAGWRATPPQ